MATDAVPESEAALLNRIALEFHDAGRILAGIRRDASVERHTDGAVRDLRRPDTPVEVTLHAIWVELLNVTDCGVDDDFFALGGQSMLAVQMLSRIHEECGVELSVDIVFTESLTIASLAKRIEESGAP